MPSLRQARERRGWTLADMARHAGINPKTLWYVESGVRVPRVSTAARIAAALGDGWTAYGVRQAALGGGAGG